MFRILPLPLLLLPVLICFALFFLRDRFTPAASTLQAQKWSLVPGALLLIPCLSYNWAFWHFGEYLPFAYMSGLPAFLPFEILCSLVSGFLFFVSWLLARYVCRVGLARAFAMTAGRFRLPLLVCAITSAANLVAVLLLHVSLLPSLTPTKPFDLGSPGKVAGCLVLLLVLGPLAEELVFRGWLYTPLFRKVGRTAALCLTSAFFALAHSRPLGLSIYLFLIGLLLGWSYQKTGSLATSFVLHGFISTLLLYWYLL